MNTSSTAAVSSVFPVYFVSHCGGLWPWVDGMGQRFAKGSGLPYHNMRGDLMEFLRS